GDAPPHAEVGGGAEDVAPDDDELPGDPRQLDPVGGEHLGVPGGRGEAIDRAAAPGLRELLVLEETEPPRRTQMDDALEPGVLLVVVGEALAGDPAQQVPVEAGAPAGE